MRHKHPVLPRVLPAACLLLLATGLAGAQQANTPRRLNSLVVELAHLDFQAAPGHDYTQEPFRRLSITLPHRGWIYISLQGTVKPGDQVWLTLDDDNKDAAVLSAPGETMRCVAAGEHRLAVWTAGKPNLKDLIVRSVPEIMMYMFEGAEPPAGTRCYRYSWDFLKRWMLPNCNLIVSQVRDAYAPYARQWHQLGGHWLGNQGMNSLRAPGADLVHIWTELLSKPMLDGLIYDELLPQDTPRLAHYAAALSTLRRVPAMAGKHVYLFSPVSTFADASLVTQCFQIDHTQACHGKASLLLQPYDKRVITLRRLGLKLQPGKQYTLSAYFRTRGCKRGAYTGVFIIDEGWHTTNGSMVRPAEGDTNWQRVTRTFTPRPSSTGLYQLIVCPPAAGKVWLDAVQLEAGATATKYTGDSTCNLITNSDFEKGPQGWLDQVTAWSDFADSVIKADAYFAPEMYMNEAPTEQQAKDAIANYLVGRFTDIRRAHPGIERHLLITFSAGNGPLAYSNDRYPNVDYKVLLDMEFHALANSPCFNDLWGVGFWSGHYMNEEVTRWYAALFRHYLIDGSRQRLTNDPYMLDHLVNPGFEQGAKGWTLQPAPGGVAEVVPVSSMPEGGPKGRYSPVPEGRYVLHTKRPGKIPNVISQPITHLTPGRLYSLKLYTTDPGYSNKLLPTVIRLEGVQELPEKTRNNVWSVRDAKLNVYWNCDYRVFRATGTGGRLVLSDGAPGEMYWDFVEIQPYFAEAV